MRQEAEINGTNTTDLYINITITDDKTMSAVVDTYSNSSIIRSADTSYGKEWQFYFDDAYSGGDSDVAYAQAHLHTVHGIQILGAMQ